MDEQLDYGSTRNFYRSRLLKSCYQEINYKIISFFGQLDTNLSILDVGCGDGFFLSILRDLGFLNIKGIDLSEAFIMKCRKKGLIVDKKDFLTYADEKYDIILMIELLEHTKEPELFLNKARFLLNTRGKILLTVPVFDSIYEKYLRLRTGLNRLEQLQELDNAHLQAFNRKSMEHLVRRNGKFRIIVCEHFYNLLHPRLEILLGKKAASFINQITFFNHFGDWLLMILEKDSQKSI